VKLKLNPEKHLSTLFPTRVGRVVIPNYADINPGLESAILSRMEAEQGVTHSNIGGWQSKSDLPEWPEPEAAEVVDSFRNAVINMIRLTDQIEPFDVDLHIAAWANVNRQGNFNQLHNHPENAWSGVYYVRAGDYAEDTIRNPGELHFHDPRERINMIDQPGVPFGKPVAIRPAEGLMLLFPSWLGHSVNVFYSDTVRISIAFNAQILKLTSTEY